MTTKEQFIEMAKGITRPGIDQMIMKFRPEKLADGLKSLKISTRTASAGLLTKPLSLAALPA